MLSNALFIHYSSWFVIKTGHYFKGNTGHWFLYFCRGF